MEVQYIGMETLDHIYFSWIFSGKAEPRWVEA